MQPSFSAALRFWLLLGWISFGGPSGQIAIMYRELVEKKQWISSERFMHALNYCMLLPGPEALQLAIYIGWLWQQTWGGLVAGLLFILPSIFLMWGLSYIYIEYGTLPWIAALFYGLKPAVVAMVFLALCRIGQKALHHYEHYGIAALSFTALIFFKIPFPLIIVGALIIGYFFLPGAQAPSPHTQAPVKFRFSTLVIGCALWGLPVLLLGYIAGWGHVILQEALFFSKAALITFGGAYAVLSYVAEYAVNHLWISADQMIDGLGLAETTPGPLIIVLQFVGFLAAWRWPEPFEPFLAATLGAFITSWTTFVPSFLFIFLGAPYIEKLRDNAPLNAALSAVTAAIVGVILNLALWFGLHVFMTPAGVDLNALLIGLLAYIALARLHWHIVLVIVLSALLGWLLK